MAAKITKRERCYVPSDLSATTCDRVLGEKKSNLNLTTNLKEIRGKNILKLANFTPWETLKANG